MIALLKIPNVRLLFAAQALGMSSTPLNTLLGGIIGTRLAPDPRLATLPVALVIVAAAGLVWLLRLWIGSAQGFKPKVQDGGS